jgi:hypothetical protein
VSGAEAVSVAAPMMRTVRRRLRWKVRDSEMIRSTPALRIAVRDVGATLDPGDFDRARTEGHVVQLAFPPGLSLERAKAC